MRVGIHFWREKRCSHSLERECSPCFKQAMGRYLGQKEFEEAWNARVPVGPDDVVEDFELFFTVPPL
jgi:hypothetical protein